MGFVGKEIKAYRKKRGLSQKELGEKLNVSQAMIAQYESGKREPKIETIDKIAKALDVDPFSLYSFDIATEVLERSINDKEKSLLDNYNKLNDTGQKEALKRVEELTEIPKYQRAVVNLFSGMGNILSDMDLDKDITTVIEYVPVKEDKLDPDNPPTGENKPLKPD